MKKIELPRLRPLAGCEGDPAAALRRAAADAPYLAHLARRRADLVSRLETEAPDTIIEEEIRGMSVDGGVGGGRPDIEMKALRDAKQASHLVIAGADLAGVSTVAQVTAALTRFADAAVEAALRGAARHVATQGRLAAGDADPLNGFFVLAMGKMGAHELNYSSDVDLIVVYEPETFPVPPAEAQDVAVRLTRELVRRLEERTEDGYVVRTDLRLRPDPASTAVAVSTTFAHTYYGAVGQNWERMAHIKARICAGDREAGERYLAELESFIWRRHLDYWAIADIHSIKRQIHSHGRHAPIGDRAFDVKLGVGGIREIEFLAQVQQLILGGRSPELRLARTTEALAALVKGAGMKRGEAQALTTAYDFLRGVEHRLQMINDEQTHMLADDAARREVIARLSGFDVRDEFERGLAQVRRTVHSAYSDLFAQEERLSGEAGNLVFTGVDDDPGTVETLTAMGFSDPSHVIETFRRWHRGSIRATRTARGRELLTIVGPRLLAAMSAMGDPDGAFERFADFFAALPAGVQTMSMWVARPELAEDVVETMSFAPRLARDLSRRPAILDAMTDGAFWRPIAEDVAGRRRETLQAWIAQEDGFEGALNAARRFHREEAFRISYQLLRRRVDAGEAGEAFADLADACVQVLADIASAEVENRYGQPIGRWLVCGLGKLGGRELSAASDLDMMVIYDPVEAMADGPAARFVQRLVAALTAPTEEGRLYEVDMQLRPSGRAGPVAVRLPAFQSYYAKEAWTWEFMALTRLRPIAGDPGLREQVAAARLAALAIKAGDPKLGEDVLDMRRRLAREKPAKSHWDLKFTAGGIVDVEFVVQHGILTSGDRIGEVANPGTLPAIEALQRAGTFSAEEAKALSGALRLQLDLQQALRAAIGDGLDPRTASPGLRSWLAKLAGADDFERLEALLAEHQANAAAVRERRIGSLAGG